MTYGDGEGNKKPLTALDVAGHEMSHGLTAATAKLNYSGESGGLNEATSDMFGTSVEFFANNASDKGDYLIGEKIDINGDGTPLRYMDKPSKDGDSADYWSSTRGQQGRALLVRPRQPLLLPAVRGQRREDDQRGELQLADLRRLEGHRDRPGQGVQDLVQGALHVHDLDHQLRKARTATLQAAADLYGATSAEYKAVAAAWTAINVK